MRCPALAFTLSALALALAWPAGAAETMDPELADVVRRLERSSVSFDNSAIRESLVEIVRRDRDNLEAWWQIAWIDLADATKRDPLAKERPLLMRGDRLARLIELAHARGQTAFGHFLAARFALLHHAYERARTEIDRALGHEPASTRYLYTRARIVLAEGRWKRSDPILREGIEAMEAARAAWRADPSVFVGAHDFDSAIASAYARMSPREDEKVIEHYLRVVDLARDDRTARAYAWSNASMAYRRLGRCREALEAAESALAEFGFRAARRNAAYARICLDMEAMGLAGTAGPATHREGPATAKER